MPVRLGWSLLACLCLTLAAAGQASGAPSAGPSCAEGPARVGATIQGTPCDDTIVVPPGVAAVDAGGGDDTIVPGPVAAAESCPVGCFLDIGSQTFDGGPGDDVVYGERGNDRLLGGGGEDRLFGGIGDDVLLGGSGNDRLSGGFGHDTIDGGPGDDYVRGDATIDELADSGGGADTISYSSGVAPGFFEHDLDPDASGGLPPLGGERGVYLDLSAAPQTLNGDNGVADFAGGVDEVEGADFEVVVGTAFSDYIVGGGAAETFYGGGGADAILGGGGDDTIHGGADGDHLDGEEGADAIDGGPGADHCASPTAGTDCDSASNGGGVVVRDQSKVSVGRMTPGGAGLDHLYLSGSEAADEVTATYSAGPPASVSFALGAGSAAPFNTSPEANGGCAPPSGDEVACQLSGALDSLVLAGFGGDDALAVAGFPPTVGLVLTGGEGDDSLSGSDLGEDVLVGGTGDGEDVLVARQGDDALVNNAGDDQLSGGEGNDLFVSDSICDVDTIDGGTQRDNASWTRYREGGGVAADLGLGAAGAPGAGGDPSCPGGDLAELVSIEDLEGTPQGDFFTGDAADNQLLGWAGADAYSSGAGQDRILANSGDFDPPLECGPGADTALIDFAEFGDVAGPDCEDVREAAKNSFRVETDLEEPPAPSASQPQPAAAGGDEARPPRRRPLPPCIGAGPRTGAAATRCAVRPRRLRVDAGGAVRGTRWRSWGGRRAVGFGRLLVRARGGRFAAPAKVLVQAPRRCGARAWYTRLTVRFGRRYRHAYLRRAARPTPCAIRLRRDGHGRGQRR